MSILQYPEAMNSKDLQIWNNSAFDNGETEDSATTIKQPSWSPLKPILFNRSESLDSVSAKENQTPLFENSSVSLKSSIKPLHPKNYIQLSQLNQNGTYSMQGLIEKVGLNSKGTEDVRYEKKIDKEIEEIEKEISRLSSRLEALKIEKFEKNAKADVEKRKKVVPAKFMEQKQCVKNTDSAKKIEQTLKLSVITKDQRRGLSMGPSEISKGTRGGVSLGPLEIVSGMKKQQLGKQEITPVQPIQSRRKSCFWKLQDIDEEKVAKERGKSLTVSPKLGKTMARTNQGSRQFATTMGSKKSVKKEDALVNSIQPKKLFKGGEKSVSTKKPLRPGRVIASRYNQNNVQSNWNSANRKRSLPENDDGESNRCDQKRSLSIGKSSESMSEIGREEGIEIRAKK